MFRVNYVSSKINDNIMVYGVFFLGGYQENLKI